MCVVIKCFICSEEIDLDNDEWKYENNEIVCKEC